MKKNGKKKKERLPSPPRRRPREKSNSPRKKRVEESPSSSSNRKRGKKESSRSASPKKTRTSPRRLSVTTKTGAETLRSESVPSSGDAIQKQSSSTFPSFRIPKLKTVGKELLSDAGKATQRQNLINPEMPPTEALLRGRKRNSEGGRSSTNFCTNSESNQKNVKITYCHPTSTDKPTVERQSNPSGSGVVEKSRKSEPLKVKRRLGSLSDSVVSIPSESTSKSHFVFLNDKEPMKNKEIEIGKFVTLNSSIVFPDLPDYADSEGEEIMEWENPVPQILKLVQQASNLSENYDNPSSPIQTHCLNSSFIDVEEMDMDVDPDPTEQLVIVPDTNIWIGNMNLIKRLLDEKFPRVSEPTIIIPWMVLQELDVSLHKTNVDKDKSRKPVNFIYSLLSSKHPRVKGQRASDAAISKLKFDEIVPDDSILGCVFQMQKNNNIVIFLTNDRNLLNKALVNGVIASDSNSVFTRINEILSNTLPGAGLAQSSSKNSITADSTSEVNFKVESKRNNPFSVEFDDDPMTGSGGPPLTKIPTISQRFSSCSGIESVEIFEAIRLAFSCVIRWKMVEDYGLGSWEFGLKIKPPWSLKTSITCILLHWLANFSFVFSRRGDVHFKKLAGLVEDYKSAPHSKRAAIENSVVDTALGIFNLCSDQALMNEAPVLQCRQLLLSSAIANQS